MESVIEKLSKTEYSKKMWDNWSLEEIKTLLEIYHIFVKKECDIFDLIYHHHGCDTYEDIFRDYNERYVEDKEAGVQEAIENINVQLTNRQYP